MIADVLILALAVILGLVKFLLIPWIEELIETREVIYANGKPYLFRYFIWKPENKNLGRIYLHNIVQSDDSRALHDHPWRFTSLILKGGYWEYGDTRQVPERNRIPWNWKLAEHFAAERDTDLKPNKFLSSFTPGQSFRWFGPGSIVRNRAGWRHRLVIPEGGNAWTLVRTSGKVREWGFYPNDKFCHHTHYDNLTGLCNED